MTPQPAAPAKKFPVVLIVVIVLVAMCCPVTGILAAIAIPNFIKFQSRAKQGECKANLKSAFYAAQSYQAEHDELTTDPAKLGFSPEMGNRYVYAFEVGGDPKAIIPARPRQDQKVTSTDEAIQAMSRIEGIGLTGDCPGCVLTIGCAGNIDNDSELDVWSISTGNRTGKSGVITAGTPVHHYDDVSDRYDEDPSAPEVPAVGE